MVAFWDCQSIMYQLLGHGDLNFVSRIAVLILFEVGSLIWCMDASLDGDMLGTICCGCCVVCFK